jgi:hypothetical protein
MTTVTPFILPVGWPSLPDARMLITEKVGPVWLVSRQGEKIQVEIYAQSLFPRPERHAWCLPPADYASDHSGVFNRYRRDSRNNFNLAIASSRIAFSDA